MKRPPLVMLWAADKKMWRAFQSASSCRGYAADAAIFMREPTLHERADVLGCLSHSTLPTVVYLGDVVQLPQLPTSG
jgi:hypothetical protein